MKKPLLGLIPLVLALIVIGYLLYILRSSQAMSLNDPCIPTFADGGGPHYIDDIPFREKLASESENGQKLIVKGKIFKSDCMTPLPNIVLNVWHADENGNYQNNSHRGKIVSKSNGSYTLETVIPKGYGEGTGYRPPHIHFKAFQDGKEIITSQLFFPDVKGRPGFNDGYIARIEEKDEWGKKVIHAYHDIILPL